VNPLPGYHITTPYGQPGSWAAGYHTGDDYSTNGVTGVPVRPARLGRVVSTDNAWGDSYGKHIVIEGRLGLIRHGYCHLDGIRVHPGDKVGPGTVIGYSGNSGRSTGPHLHYEERRRPFKYANHRRPRFNKMGPQTLAGILRVLAKRAADKA
jgi:murein DD-endopeptidase MepM/ murein hydrolase activator NlpD